jgi:hypothetical protein
VSGSRDCIRPALGPRDRLLLRLRSGSHPPAARR